ncbi:Myc-type, basic helix-loop-helix (bHLH) domain [Dillenia turbinata]|uniref:Myc-type, basic helix-loop-helix (BHLH) domain n=1 Tax=Dillenia turbinata TaxID=194707 RepID=A0AAN8VIM7_9MAGN
MYHHSASSSSTTSSSQSSIGEPGLFRYSSAPGSLLTQAVGSIIGQSNREFSALGSTSQGHYFPNESSESSCKATGTSSPSKTATAAPLQRQRSNLSSVLTRHSSSPAGFFNHLSTENGSSVTRESGSYHSQGDSSGGHVMSRLKPQLSFTRQDSLSHISEVSENIVEGYSSDNRHRNAANSYSSAGFAIGSWDDNNSIIFSSPPSKRSKSVNGDILNSLTALETQFILPQTSLEMATMDKVLQIPDNSVPCKIRAKRGCATHPRSIAERERRTRISRKLKKLQELVPNMDKQTSYSDMLDLAVQHIKGLQNQVQTYQK